MRRLLVLLKNILSLPKRLTSHIALFCILQEAVVDRTAAICSGVRFYRGKIGKYSYIGNNSFVSDTDIGNFTSISTDCNIHTGFYHNPISNPYIISDSCPPKNLKFMSCKILFHNVFPFMKNRRSRNPVRWM